MNAWRPCRRQASAHSVLCLRHESVFAGVLIGALLCGYPQPVDELQQEFVTKTPVTARKPS